jgi:hypothetical protein
MDLSSFGEEKRGPVVALPDAAPVLERALEYRRFFLDLARKAPYLQELWRPERSGGPRIRTRRRGLTLEERRTLIRR